MRQFYTKMDDTTYEDKLFDNYEYLRRTYRNMDAWIEADPVSEHISPSGQLNGNMTDVERYVIQ